MAYEHIPYCHCDNAQEALKSAMLFRKIIQVEKIDERTAKIVLDNGLLITTYGNEGCGGCESGWYKLSELNICDNVITDVTVEVDDRETVFSICVFADNQKVNLVSYNGEDNGWYGTGFYLRGTVEEWY